MEQTMPLSNRWVRLLPIALIVSTVIAVDQVSKHLIRANFELGASHPESWLVRLTYVENTGSAFGLFTGQTVFLIFASIFALAIVVFMFRHAGISSLPLRISLGLMLGGGLSNLADRVRFGGVTDFLDLRVWPIFNLADSCVVVGIALLAFTVFMRDRGKGLGVRD